eukprot:PhF_6_TR17346/c0_g1_i3/m.26568
MSTLPKGYSRVRTSTNASPICNQCHQEGHWTYECTGAPKSKDISSSKRGRDEIPADLSRNPLQRSTGNGADKYTQQEIDSVRAVLRAEVREQILREHPELFMDPQDDEASTESSSDSDDD